MSSSCGDLEAACGPGAALALPLGAASAWTATTGAFATVAEAARAPRPAATALARRVAADALESADGAIDDRG